MEAAIVPGVVPAALSPWQMRWQRTRSMLTATESRAILETANWWSPYAWGHVDKGF
jgi:hypothetical protein